MARRTPPIRCHCPGPCTGRGNRPAYAIHADVQERSVGRWVDTGKITLDADGQIDFVAADQMRARTVGSSFGWAATEAAEGDNVPGAISYAVEQARHERAKADLAELKAAERAGELVDVAEAERRWFDALRALRSRVEAVTDRIADKAASEARRAKDPEAAKHVVRTLLGAEINAALVEAAEAIDALAGEEEAA